MPGQIDVAGATLYFKFSTRAFSTGIPTILSSSPVISIYKDDSTTQSTTGVTLTANFDSVAGLNHVSIDTTADATFYANGHKYYLVITTGTVDSVSVVGEVVGEFELSAPVVTVGTTLAVDGSGRVDVGKILGTTSQGTAGYVGLDWGHITAPTTTVGLTNTTISSAQVVASVSGAVGSVTGAVGSVTGNVGGNVTGTVASVVGNVGGNVTGTVASVVGNVGGNVTGTVGSVVGAVGSVTGNVGGNVTGTVASVVGNVGGNVTGSVGSVVGGVTLADAVTHGGATAIVSLKQITVTNPSGDALFAKSTSAGSAVKLVGLDTNYPYAGLSITGGSRGVKVVSTGSGSEGMEITGIYRGVSILGGTALRINSNDANGSGVVISSGGGTGPGVIVAGGDSGAAILLKGPYTTPGPVIVIDATADLSGVDGGPGILVQTGDGHGINIVAAGSGKHGIISTGGTGGDGMHLVGGTDGNGLHLSGAGTGSSLSATDDVEQAGVATTFFGRMRQFYNRFFPEGPSGEVVKNSGTHTIVTKDSTGSVITTQPYTDDGSGNETIGPAS